MRYIANLFVLLSITVSINAAPFSLKGKVVDVNTNQGIGYATAFVRISGTSDVVSGTVTDESGDFIIENLKQGNYEMVLSFIGYQTYIQNVSVHSDVNVGTLKMKEDNTLLGEVTVVGQKSQMKFELDKKVFNVSQNLSSIGGTASDVLSNIPSVEVNSEGQVSLRGNSSVTVWINGKASGMSAENRGDILRQLPSESIDRIEVITNPSSKYSPEGSAGIINVILKRDRRAGYYGGIQTGTNNFGGYNASGNINYTSGKIEAFANVGYRHTIFKNGGYSDRSGLDENDEIISSLHQDTNGKMKGDYTMLRGGLTWLPTHKDQFSLSGMAWLGGYNRNNDVQYLFNQGGINIYNRRRLQAENADHNFYNAEFGYKHDFSQSSNLNFSATYSFMDFGMNIDYTDETENSDLSSTNSYQRQEGGNKIKTWDLQLDYTKSWVNGNKLEAGYKGTIQDNDSPVNMYTGDDRDNAMFDADRYNRFLYNQNVQALYLTYGGKIGSFGYQAGLRGEYTKIEGKPNSWDIQTDREIGGTAYDREYFKLFPSAFLSYTLPQDNEIQLNYTRRISRPGVLQLNSFRNLSDATNISYGNPLLNPSYTDAFELNYIKNWEQHTLSISGYYRSSEDIIQQIRFMGNDNTMYSTYENVSSSTSAGLEVVSKNKLLKILDLTSTVNLFYYKLDGFNLHPEESLEMISDAGNKNFAWNARIMANILLPWSMSGQVTGNYNSRQIIAQGESRANFSLDAGLRKSFADNAFSIALTARDILNSRKMKSFTSGNGFQQYSESWFGGRFLGATISWNFGNMKTKRKPALQDEPETIPMGGM